MTVEKTRFVDTAATAKVIRSIDRTLKDNAWLVVTGDVGSGKSTLREMLTAAWRAEPQKYVVIDLPAFRAEGSVLNVLMRYMIRTISPDEQSPGDAIARFNRLKTVLMQAHRRRVKPVLVIDEAQELNEISIREIKKLHEIAAFGMPHLFPIIMFAKSNTDRLDAILSGREIGYRVRRSYMAPLSPDELIEFAKHFGLTFEDTKAKNYFLEFCHPSPLGVEHIADRAKDFLGTTSLSRDKLQKLVAQTAKDELKFYGISYGDICQRYNDVHNATISKQTAMRVIENNGSVKSATADRIRGVTRDLITEARSERA